MLLKIEKKKKRRFNATKYQWLLWCYIDKLKCLDLFCISPAEKHQRTLIVYFLSQAAERISMGPFEKQSQWYQSRLPIGRQLKLLDTGNQFCNKIYVSDLVTEIQSSGASNRCVWWNNLTHWVHNFSKINYSVTIDFKMIFWIAGGGGIGIMEIWAKQRL